jgi:peptidoglycan/xylan/chitin deacetylase (PgdA/CDA1 family)
VIRTETAAFDEVLDFWRLSRDGVSGDVLLTEADSPDPGLQHSVVHLRGGGEPRLYRFAEDGTYVFASVTPIEKPPDSLSVLARLEAVDGSCGSYVLEDAERSVVYLPFSPSDAVRGFRGEHYVAPPRAMGAYYSLKHLLPRPLLMKARSYFARRQMRSLAFPRWPIETSLDDLQRRILALILRATTEESLAFVWFWPSGRRAAVTLTHDVEGPDGLAMISRFIEAEREHGLVSSFNLVPCRYEIPDEVLSHIRASGCEIGVHGWDHEGSLVADRALFLDRAARINAIAQRWGAVGFRSPSTHRNADWFGELLFDYDSSFPDTDPFEPQAGGCLSLFPFMMGGLVELPITMPQDHTQFVLLGLRDAGVWRRKAESVVDRHGLVCMLTHPDTAEGYSGTDRVLQLYKEMLGALAADEDLWRALPRDVASWWRVRARTSVADDGTTLDGAGETGASLAHASLRDGALVLERAGSTTEGSMR